MAPKTSSASSISGLPGSEDVAKKLLLPSEQLNSKPQRLLLKIDDHWYDLTQWQNTHPGGKQILQHLNGEDATDAFYSLHSQEARERLKRMPKVTIDPSQPDAPVAHTSELDRNFRLFRQKLEDEGWFKRNPLYDALHLLSIVFLLVVGTVVAYTEYKFLATFLIGVGMEQAGWIGHDYCHGRGNISWWIGRLVGGFCNGFSAIWWNNKHNTHHCYPNTVGIDEDIANDPVFHIWAPEKGKDHPMRRYQHLYYFPVVAVLFYSWRLQSFQNAWRTRNMFELSMMAVNYAWLLLLPWSVALGSIYIAGLLVGVIVTATHQSEELLNPPDKSYDFVLAQFVTTRDAFSPNPVVNWLWGGMQYQLEHHLFPTMPKYYYGSLAPKLRQFAKENRIEYRVDGMYEILCRNLDTMRKFAEAAPVNP